MRGVRGVFSCHYTRVVWGYLVGTTACVRGVFSQTHRVRVREGAFPLRIACA